jgi:hypothetical protein
MMNSVHQDEQAGEHQARHHAGEEQRPIEVSVAMP